MMGIGRLDGEEGAVGVWIDIFGTERVGVIGAASTFLEGLDAVAGSFFVFWFFVKSTGASEDMIPE